MLIPVRLAPVLLSRRSLRFPVLQAQPLLELFDTELPFNRVPLYDKIEELAAERVPPGSLLHSQPLSELHPASW